MKNILSIDVEDYFMVSAFADKIPFDSWNQYESRVVMNTEILLSLLQKFKVKATFFVLGWVAEKFPTLVKKINHDGHEIASHGYAHELLYLQKPDKFTLDLRKSKTILEDITGDSVLGYRAPSYSFTKKTLWVLDILIDMGFKYDSSVFPIHHDRGGLPHANRFPYSLHANNGEILEFPLSTIRLLGNNIPVAGGGYFRLFPYFFISQSIRAINREGQPAILYFHPWEIDPQQPKISSSKFNEFRHYNNLDQAEKKLKRLLGEFEFTSIRDVIESGN